MNRKIVVAFICMITSLMLFNTSTIADMVLADGKATGQWFNPERGGEGFYIEIINTGGSEQIGVAMFTFDDNGDPLWVSGNVAIGNTDEVVGIPVFQFDGPLWGPDFDSGDLNQTPFGTITARFPNCDSALFSVQTEAGVGLASRDYTLIRLTDIKGIDCTDPKPPQQGYTPGRWSGDGVCFTVGEDGMSIVGGNLSTCDAQAAFDSNLDGLNNDLEECGVEADCEGVWNIVDGAFSCVSELGTLAIGTFSSTTSASGSAYEGEGGRGDFCAATWSATPDN
jgi:hypothetical protein